MAILDLPESILQSLSSVLTQLQQVLPAPRQPTDFSAIAFRWENQQLVAIQQPKKMYLEDLKGLERPGWLTAKSRSKDRLFIW